MKPHHGCPKPVRQAQADAGECKLSSEAYPHFQKEQVLQRDKRRYCQLQSRAKTMVEDGGGGEWTYRTGWSYGANLF